MRIDFRLAAKAADLLAYPDEGLPARAVALAEQVKWYSETWEDLFEAFALHLSLTPLTELEEAYTRTFDLNPSCCMDLGWHLFGEAYKRGHFLANLRTRLHQHGIAEGSELPDHLPTVLRLLPKLEKEDAEGLVRDCVLPALAKIRGNLGEAAGPYPLVLEAIELLLKELAPEGEAVSEGGGSCGSCGCGGHGHDHETGHGPLNGHGR
jgi:nitrate reductase delta subunit